MQRWIGVVEVLSFNYNAKVNELESCLSVYSHAKISSPATPNVIDCQVTSLYSCTIQQRDLYCCTLRDRYYRPAHWLLRRRKSTPYNTRFLHENGIVTSELECFLSYDTTVTGPCRPLRRRRSRATRNLKKPIHDIFVSGYS